MVAILENWRYWTQALKALEAADNKYMNQIRILNKL